MCLNFLCSKVIEYTYQSHSRVWLTFFYLNKLKRKICLRKIWNWLKHLEVEWLSNHKLRLGQPFISHSNYILYIRLGIPIAAADVNCSFCACTQLSSRHLVNGFPHRNYKRKAIMSEITNLCAAADILIAEEQFQCFNTRTTRRMDLVFTIDTTEVLGGGRHNYRRKQPFQWILKGSRSNIGILSRSSISDCYSKEMG